MRFKVTKQNNGYMWIFVFKFVADLHSIIIYYACAIVKKLKLCNLYMYI